MSRQVLTYPDLPNLSLQYLPLAGGQLTGNLGVGVAPAAWQAGFRAIQIGAGGSIYGVDGTNETVWFASNSYVSGSGDKPLIGGRPASRMQLYNGDITLQTAPQVAAGVSQTFTTRFRVGLAGDAQLTGASGGEAAFTIRSDDNQWAMVKLNRTDDLARWLFGANPGSKNFSFARYNDAGGFLNFPFEISRATGTVTLSPDAGSDGLVSWGSIKGGNDTGMSLGAADRRWGNVYTLNVRNVGTNLHLHGEGAGVLPDNDNAQNLGYSGFRWAAVYAAAGSINTCSREIKEIVGTVDETVALQQLMSLPAIYRFYYKHVDPETANGENPVLVTDTSMEFIGPIAEELPMDMKVGEVEAGSVNTEGHLMASLRGAVKEYRDRITDLANRMTILEGRLPA